MLFTTLILVRLECITAPNNIKSRRCIGVNCDALSTITPDALIAIYVMFPVVRYVGVFPVTAEKLTIVLVGASGLSKFVITPIPAVTLYLVGSAFIDIKPFLISPVERNAFL